MKIKGPLMAVITLFATLSAAQGVPSSSEVQGQVVAVNGKTVVAFFPPVSDAQMEKDPDLNEALSDFQLYTSNARRPLRNEGIDFQVLYVHSFRIRVGKAVTTFSPSKVNVGYYFIAPGKKPRVEYGVMTDADLLQIAKEYFGSSTD